MNLIFLMDPLESVVMEKDTTFILMLGAHKKGHKVFYLPHNGITVKNGRCEFDVIAVIPQQVQGRAFINHQAMHLTQEEIDAVFIRTDPPFDENYLMHTWLLEQLPQNIPVMNSPRGIRTVNEKLWAMQFTSIIPRTIVSRRIDVLYEFLNEEQKVIAKPTNAFGGASIFLVEDEDTNARVILETLTERGKKEIILQQYIPEAQKGDKRILLLNGEPLGAILRVHADGDHRNNFFAGGNPAETKITERDLKVIETLCPKLQELGLYFVGIDILGDYLIEVNVTSPTCLQEINQFENKNLENTIITFAENLIDQMKS